jgi:hypothetical protein
MTLRSRFLLPAGIASAVLAFWFLWPVDRVTPRMACQLSAGMSLAEVEQILGQPIDQSRYVIMLDSGVRTYVTPEERFRTQYCLLPNSPWDPALRTVGEPLPLNWGPGTRAEYWAGSQVVVIGVLRMENNVEFLEQYIVVPVLRDGGGPLGWLQHHYQEWSSPGSSTLVAPVLPIPPPPPPPLPGDQ